MKTFLLATTLATVAILVTIFSQVLSIALIYLLMKIIVALAPGLGMWLVEGGKVFHLEFTVEQIPSIAAFLCFVGHFFKSTLSQERK